MDNISVQPNQYFLTNKLNDKALGSRILEWQQTNAQYLTETTLFSEDSQSTYDQLVDNLAECLVAFNGCHVIESKLPSTKQELQQNMDENSTLGRWCLWYIDDWCIEAIVERLMSLRSDESGSYDADEFNAFKLIKFKIPASTMGNQYALKSWVCQENIAQIRNQDAAPDEFILTALSAKQGNEDTAGEFSKIVLGDLFNINIELIKSFAECYCIDVNEQGKFELTELETQCFAIVLDLFTHNGLSLDLRDFARYISMVLINFRRLPGNDASASAMREALGQALQALNIPRNQDAFIGNAFEKCDQKSYNKRINDILLCQGGLAKKKPSDRDETELNWLKLDEKYQNFKKANDLDLSKIELLNPHATNDANPIAEANTVKDLAKFKGHFSPAELEVIKQFLLSASDTNDKYSAAYHKLCFIDWSKLENFFEVSAPKRSMALSIRTTNFFKKLNNQTADQEFTLTDNDLMAIDLANNKPGSLRKDELQLVEEFISAHRSELEQDKKLFKAWEKLQHISNITCHEFISGLYQTLIEQSSEQSTLLKITLSLYDFDGSFLNKHNHDACRYFSIMYGPVLTKLTETFPDKFILLLGYRGIVPTEKGIPNPLTNFDDYLKYQEAQFNDASTTKGKAKLHELECTTTKSTAYQLKFKVTLTSILDNEISDNSCYLLWRINSNSVGLMLPHDLNLIVQENAPLVSYFCQNLKPASGEIKAPDLTNLSTLLSDESLQLGAFISEPNSSKSTRSRSNSSFKALNYIKAPEERTLIEKFNNICSKIDECEDSECIELTKKLKQKFADLSTEYLLVIQSFLDCKLTFEQIQTLNQHLADLQLEILQSELESVRQDLLHVVQSIGVAYNIWPNAALNDEFAIVTPYNIPCLYQHMSHGERLVSLVGQMLEKPLFIAKPSVLTNALNELQRAAVGPEIIASHDIHQSRLPKILQAVQGYNGYTLYQSVNHNQDSYFADDTSLANKSLFLHIDDDEIKVALDLLKRHVQDHPYLRGNLNVAVYNCPSIEFINKLYSELLSSEFFSNVNVCLTVVDQNKIALPTAYQNFELLNRQYTNRIEDQSAIGSLRIRILSAAEINGLANQLDSFLPKDSSKTLNYIFDVALMFHYGDINAEFDFERCAIQILCSEQDLFSSGLKFAPKVSDAISTQLLISPEQNLYNLISLNALACMAEKYFKDNYDNYSQLQGYLQQSIDGTLDANHYLETSVPAYKLKVKDSSTEKQILYIHKYSNIVITFDNLLTKKQFADLPDVKLIKYSQTGNGNTSIFISTQMSLDKYENYLSSLLNDLRVDASNKALNTIKDKASKLTGDLLMHAQLAPIYTGEMLGLVLTSQVMTFVLSKFNELQAATDPSQTMPKLLNYPSNAIFSLDEYNSWFGSTNSNVADLLSLQVSKRTDGRFLLTMVVAESKFLSEESRAATNLSIKQTKASAESFFDLFSHDPAICTIDQRIRIRQLIFMLFQSDSFKTKNKQLQNELKQALLAGTFDISLLAISCVYVYHRKAAGEDVIVHNFEYGSTQNNTFKHKPIGSQFIFYEYATRNLLEGLLSSQNLNAVCTQMLLPQHDFSKFLSAQYFVVLDATPSPEIVAKAEADRDMVNKTPKVAKITKKTKSTRGTKVSKPQV